MKIPARPGPGDDGNGRTDQDEGGRDQDDEGGHLDFKGFDLLAEVFRGAAHHEPGHEDGDQDEHQHPVQAGAHTPEDDLPQLDQPQGRQSAQGCERIVHGVDAPAGGRRGHDGPEGGIDDSEPDLLAFHVAPGLGGPRRPDRCSWPGKTHFPPPRSAGQTPRSGRRISSMAAMRDRPLPPVPHQAPGR